MNSTQLSLSRSMGWMFKSPNWMTNIFWMVICALLGTVVIGSLVAMGYQIEIIQKRSRGREDALPDFQAERFMDYLVRGAWPFLINMVFGFAISMVMMVFFVVFTLIGSLLSNGEPSPLVGVFMFMGMLIILPVAIFMSFIMGPLCLRAGLANNLSEGFKIQWAIDVAKLMWPQMLLAMVFCFVIVLLAEIVGLLMCFIGIFLTISWAQLAFADLGAQLYDIYLERGGQPVPMMGEAMDAQIL